MPPRTIVLFLGAAVATASESTCNVDQGGGSCDVQKDHSLIQIRLPRAQMLSKTKTLDPCDATALAAQRCPSSWASSLSVGGYYCITSGGCKPASSGPFASADCPSQCVLGVYDPSQPVPTAAPGGEAPPSGGGRPSVQPRRLDSAGPQDLRIFKEDKLLGCAAPIGLFPGNEKYGCGGRFSTAQTCDAPKNPVKDTKYVAAVHAGCLPGHGTYGYAYDDGVGLHQCAPVTRYEWIVCPTGQESTVDWAAEPGVIPDSTKRFRVTNGCDQAVWIHQLGFKGGFTGDAEIIKLEPNSSYTYSVPNRGISSMRFIPLTGCDDSGTNCDIQSLPPCPPAGCDIPIDTKFEASWGCQYAKGNPGDVSVCEITPQGSPVTYQDWWDASAVDGWTLPFSVLVNDGGAGLSPFDHSGTGSSQCLSVICAALNAATLCPTDEFLTNES